MSDVYLASVEAVDKSSDEESFFCQGVVEAWDEKDALWQLKKDLTARGYLMVGLGEVQTWESAQSQTRHNFKPSKWVASKN